MTLRIGIIGFGFMGRMHYRCWRQLPKISITAICDADPRAFENIAKNQGNIAGAEGDVDLAGVKLYDAVEPMLREQRLDAVSITVPTHLHAGCTIEALRSGLHVLCEKPIALNLADGRRMIEVARQSKRILQIGHCIRFWPAYAKAKEIVDGGRYGRVIAAMFQRLSATAARKSQTWFTDQSQSGGMTLDVHIHDTDFVQYLFGMPRTVQSGGATGAEGGLTHIVTRYGYDDKLVVAEGGWGMMPSYGFDMRFHIVLEKATVVFDYQRSAELRLCPSEGEAFEPPCEQGDGYLHQIAHFARRIRGELVPPVISPQDAWNSLQIVLAERESAITGREVCCAEEGCHAV